MRTESVYIDVRSVFLLCDTHGLVNYTINPALSVLFSKLQDENNAVRYAFFVFGRQHEFEMSQREYLLSSSIKIPFSSIAQDFNQLSNSCIVPLHEMNFLALDTDLNLPPESSNHTPPLFISSDASFISAAQSKGYLVCHTYLGGELDETDMEIFNTASQREDITSLLVSSDVDKTLLSIEEAYLRQKTALNDQLIRRFHDINAIHSDKQKTYILLTARNSSELKFELKLSYRLLLDKMRSLFLSFLNKQNTHFLTSFMLTFGDTQTSVPHQIDREMGREVCKEIFLNDAVFWQSPAQMLGSNPWNQLLYLPNVKRLALQSMPFISSLPVICTGSRYTKSDWLRQLKKPGQLIVHFDDCNKVIEDVRAKEPEVCVVRVYSAGTFPLDLSKIIRSWLLGNASPADVIDFDDVFSSPFYAVETPTQTPVDDSIISDDNIADTSFSMVLP